MALVRLLCICLLVTLVGSYPLTDVSSSSEGLTSTPVSKGITTMEDLKEHETDTKDKVTPRGFLEILYDMLVQTEPAYVPCKWYDAWYGLTGDNGGEPCPRRLGKMVMHSGHPGYAPYYETSNKRYY
ncbi:uncharacterized protein LOC124368479 [Homalodisca vitripennis]|uniref:uncharacterized protein LOC124368479 n=1 Tax=Homalodisca vitripennis TaxID=197043 RepID=UPI001EE9C1DE|nr:uncharacterized protein LOC124368479 [Homalodisca vitripennis]